MKAQKKQRKNLKKKKSESKGVEHPPNFSEKFIARVNKLALPLCEAEGIELVHVEYQREAGGRKLRLYIDKPGGITLSDCAYINRQFGDILDITLESNESYSLEVSSPGPERPLGSKIDFERFQGEAVKIKTNKPIDGQKNFKGVLLGISEEVVKLLINEKTVVIPFHEIDRARLVNNAKRAE